jgi:hypothetical protein
VLSHVNSRLCENVDVAIQALALNERRKHFQATMWKANPHLKDQILKQCWFLGSHSDVGGGNKRRSLSNISLVWMLAQLDEHVDINFAALLDFTSSYSKGKSSVSKEHQTLEPPQLVKMRARINDGYLRGKGMNLELLGIRLPESWLANDDVGRQSEEFYERALCPRRRKTKKAFPILFHQQRLREVLERPGRLSTEPTQFGKEFRRLGGGGETERSRGKDSFYSPSNARKET